MVKLNLFKLQEKLDEAGKPIFSPQDVKLFFAASDRAINGFLTYNSQKKRIIKLKKGLYAIKKSDTNHFAIANRAYQPSYISFETALSYYHLIPETVYSITSATSQTSRQFDIQNINYSYRKIKKNAYTGYLINTTESQPILIASPEKAVADYCYFILLGKIGSWNDRLDLRKIKLEKVRQYLSLFGDQKFINRLKKYLPDL